MDLEGHEIEELMQDLPRFRNSGRSASVLHPEHANAQAGRHISLSPPMPSTAGMSVVPLGEMADHGMSAHRGVLAPEEYDLLDWEKVEEIAFFLLGTHRREMTWLYGGPGAPSPDRLEARRRLDETMLLMKEGGANMTVLAAIFGWHIRPNGECRKMMKALMRAQRQRERNTSLCAASNS